MRTYQGRTGRGIRETTLEEYRKCLEADAITHFVKVLAKHIADRGVTPASPGDRPDRLGPGSHCSPRPPRKGWSVKPRAREVTLGSGRVDCASRIPPSGGPRVNRPWLVRGPPDGGT